MVKMIVIGSDLPYEGRVAEVGTTIVATPEHARMLKGWGKATTDRPDDEPKPEFEHVDPSPEVEHSEPSPDVDREETDLARAGSRNRRRRRDREPADAA